LPFGWTTESEMVRGESASNIDWLHAQADFRASPMIETIRNACKMHEKF